MSINEKSSVEEKIIFRAAVRVSKYEQDMDSDWTKHLLQRRLHEEIAAAIAHHKIQHIATPNFYEQRLELYVATPDEFWEIVNKKALDVARTFGMRLPVIE